MRRPRCLMVLLSCLLPVLCAADAPPASTMEADEQTLKAAKLSTDDAGLLQFFRDRTLSPQRRDQILALITRMGNDNYWIREQATLDLQGLGGSSTGLLHQAISAQATDIEIQAREILQLWSRLNDMYVRHTGQSLEVIQQAVERDKFMSPNEAKEFGLIDEVMLSRPIREEDPKTKG